MKKLLVLVAVLAVASLANAGLVTATSTVPFQVTITAANASDNADVFIDYTNYVAAGGSTAASTLTGAGADIANLFVYTAGVEGADVYYLSLARAAAGTWANGVKLATLDLNGAGNDIGTVPVTMDLYDAELNVIGQVTVLIPEPATIAVLSLGGLLLRRKK